MSERPLPWHDVPHCKEPGCGGLVIYDDELGPDIWCSICTEPFAPTPAEKAQIARANDAWDRVLRGEVHEDKACARCGGCLPIESQRLCPGCVVADTKERNLNLFPVAP